MRNLILKIDCWRAMSGEKRIGCGKLSNMDILYFLSLTSSETNKERLNILNHLRTCDDCGISYLNIILEFQAASLDVLIEDLQNGLCPWYRQTVIGFLSEFNDSSSEMLEYHKHFESCALCQAQEEKSQEDLKLFMERVGGTEKFFKETMVRYRNSFKS